MSVCMPIVYLANLKKKKKKVFTSLNTWFLFQFLVSFEQGVLNELIR